MENLHGELLGGAHSGARGGQGGARGGGGLRGGVRGGSSRRTSSRQERFISAKEVIPKMPSRNNDGSDKPRHNRKGLIQPHVSFAEAVSSGSSPEKRNEHRRGAHSEWIQVRRKVQRSDQLVSGDLRSSVAVGLSGNKRMRGSPAECRKCLRTTHRTEECRQLLMCRRCEGSGHIAANCNVRFLAPRRRKTRSRPMNLRGSPKVGKQLDPPLSQAPRKSVVSSSVSPEVNKLRDDLSKLIIININSGFISANALQEALAELLGAQHVGPVSHFRGDSYIVSLPSLEEVKMACNLGEFEVSSNFGQCKISFTPWTGDVASEGAARGTGTWVNIWNLPLHCWCWQVVVDILRPIGELVAISNGSQMEFSWCP